MEGNKLRKFTATVREVRSISFPVEAENAEEAKLVASDFYTNDDDLQGEMLKDGALERDEVSVRDNKKAETHQNPYYIVMSEWNYPTESGRDTEGTWDDEEKALAWAKEVCELEESNFSAACGDALDPAKCEPSRGDAGSYLITTKMGLDDFFFVARVIAVYPY